MNHRNSLFKRIVSNEMKLCSEDYTAKCNFAGPQYIQYRGLGGEDNHFNNMQLSLTITYNI